MSDLTTGRIQGTPADLQQPLPVEQTDRPITVSRSCVKPTHVPTADDFPDCRPCQMWREAGATWPRPCAKHYGGERR